MDKNAIKKYAIWARRELIERVSQRAMIYGITAKDIGDPKAESVNGHLLSQAEKRQRQALIRNIKTKGYEQVMEEVAYTWFNRFAALRFMEVNGYLPSHIRVFTNDAGEFKPQILAEAIHLELDGLDMNKVYELESANKSEELFKYLLIVQCNALNSILPGMFQRIEDYTELLLPDYLLRDGSVIEQMVTIIPEEDWTDQVQIIGWLYQYYNTEPKDKVFADLKKNIKITKENIPAATQLFTPDWIVHYMVENSLGRLWLEGHPNDALKSEWKYYLDEAEQEPEVQAQLAIIRKDYAALKPEEIRVIDPCMGSGHILCVLFDVLVRIYEDYGYTAREAAVKIVENNLWGLDIDERAAQLSYFAVMMKARQYDRRFFTRKVQPHVFAIQESNNLDPYCIEYFVDGRKELMSAMDILVKEMHDAKEYGSILNVTKVNFNAFYARFDEIQNESVPSFYSLQAMDVLLPFVQVAQTMAQKYHTVVTNPPYMGALNMNGKLSAFLKEHYFDYKSDSFAAFIVRCSLMTKNNGFCGFFTPYVWMFIQSYSNLRFFIYENCIIETLIQFEYSAFEEATVPVCTFTISNRNLGKRKGCYFRLTDFRGGMEIQRQKVLDGIFNPQCGYYYEQSSDNYLQVPGAPVAYWISNQLFYTFRNYPPLQNSADTKPGMQTSDNNRFLRLWTEVDFNKIGRGLTHEEAALSDYKWFPYNKGGDYRKWYGNIDYLVNFYHDGEELKHWLVNNPKDPGTKHWSRNMRNYNLYFKECLTWSSLSSGNISMRYCSGGFIFDTKGSCCFANTNLKYILGLINSNVARSYLSLLCPTLV